VINLIWECTVIIHNEELNDLPNGADWPPRKAAVEAIESLGLSINSVSSGWGCDETTPKIASLKRRVAMLENECVEKYSLIQELEKERGVLTEFVSWSLDAVFSGSDICGDAAQDKMFELGILTREIYDPEIHNLAQGSECDAGDYIYFKAPKEQE
jgi:hypothetical protein